MYSAEFDDKCRLLVMSILGVQNKCPKCGGQFSQRVQITFGLGHRVKCGHCEFYGNWRFGTILEGARITNTQFLALFFKYTLPNDAPSIAKVVGLDAKTVRTWREYFVSRMVA